MDVFAAAVAAASGSPLVAVAAVAVLVLSAALILTYAWPGPTPQMSGIPIFGSALKFFKGPLPLIAEGFRSKGPVFSINLFHKRVTFLVGPEVSSHFFKATDLELSQKEVYKFNVPTFGRGVVFDVDHTVRAEQFKFAAEILRASRMRTYVGMMVDEAEQFFKSWGDEGVVDLKEQLSELIILTASRTLLGREIRESLFQNVYKYFHDLDMGMLPISVLFPYLPIPAHRRRDSARKSLSEIFSKVISARRASGVEESDVLQGFINARYKDGRSMTDEEITGMLIALLFAGQHTSSITGTWTGLRILQNKERCMPKLIEEQKKVMKEHGNNLDYDILQKMDRMHFAIKEALRLDPPLILLLRYVHSSFVVSTKSGKSYKIPKGDIVATSPAFAHRIGSVFHQPEMYDPDRFEEGREEDKRTGPFAYIGFGGGRHGCMGETFAYMQMKTIWSHLLRNFDMELADPFPEPDYTAMVVGPKGSCRIKYRRRVLSA